MASGTFVPLAVLLALLAIDCWVYSDAKVRADRGRPVTFRAGSFAIDSPMAWFVGCLLLRILFFPLSMSSRR